MTQLFLTEQEVPLGSKVHIYLPESQSADEFNGEKVVFQTLLSTRLTKRFYEVPSGIQQVADGVILAQGMEGFVEGVLFSPVEVHSVESAVVNKRYAVFIDGKAAITEFRDSKASHKCEVVKGYDSEFALSFLYPFVQPVYNGAFDYQVKIYSYDSDTLVSKLRESQEQIALLRDKSRNLPSFLSKVENEQVYLLEALARHYRQDSLSDLIRTVKSIDGLAEKYLSFQQLPANAQLVPLN